MLPLVVDRHNPVVEQQQKLELHVQWQLGQVPEQVALVPPPEPLQLVVSVQSLGAAFAEDASIPPPITRPTILRNISRLGIGLANVRATSSIRKLIFVSFMCSTFRSGVLQ